MCHVSRNSVKQTPGKQASAGRFLVIIVLGYLGFVTAMRSFQFTGTLHPSFDQERSANFARNLKPVSGG
jgi:hypothetical protein